MGPITKEQSDQLARNWKIERYATVALLVWLLTQNTGLVIVSVLVQSWVEDLLIILGAGRRWSALVNRPDPNTKGRKQSQ